MACAEVCPARAIEAKDISTGASATRRMIVHLDECHYCGNCEANCTTREDTPPGIRLTNEFDLAGFERSAMVSKTEEKELALCEACGGVITAKAHLDWLVKRLGPLAFSNPTLFISSLKEMGFSEEVTRIAGEDLIRADRIKVLCAKCRRRATLEKF
jgi:hydrogenase-4 component H